MKRLSVLLVAVAIVLALFAAFAGISLAQTPSPPTPPPTETPVVSLTVVGQLTNETAGGTLPITTTVTLYGYDGQSLALTTPAVADSAGKVRFEGVANKPGRSFALTAAVGRTTYQTGLQPPQPGATELALTLKTYSSTTDASQVRVAQMYVLGEFLSEKELQIVNAYFLSNKGDHAVEDGERAADGRTATLRFALPKRATGVQFQGENADRFIRTDDGFLTTWGIPPGDNVGRVIVSYSLPYTGQLHMELPLQYAVQAAKALLVDQGVALTSPLLKDQGTVRRQDGATLRSYTGEAIAAGQSLALDFSGIPKLAAVEAGNAPNAPNEAGAVSLVPAPAPDFRQQIALRIVAFGLILLSAAVVWWARARRRVRHDEHAGVSPPRGHSVLVQALASLDEAHDAGKIGDADYARQRQILKAALVSALENPPPAAEATPRAVDEIEQANASFELPLAPQDGQ